MTDEAASPSTFDQALALQAEGRWAEAVALHRTLLAKQLTVSGAGNLGLALSELGQWEEAEKWIGLAARNRAGAPHLRHRLGIIHAAMGRVDAAELEYRTALALDPAYDPARLALASLYLSVGRYAEGWPLLEARVRLRPEVVPPIALNFPEWRGEALAGRSILVWCEQGFGDQIMMSRFATSLKARGAARVTLGCRPALVDLFAAAPGIDAVVCVPQGEVVAVQAHDYWSRYFSLPEHLGVTLANLPRQPYLFAPQDRRERWRGFSGVGLAWQASPTGFNGRNKSLPDADARRLIELGAISLHPEDTGVGDFADTAAIIEQLDLVISIDTAVAHLAGAMGKPCWTLLPFVGLDWRWHRDRADSPWYPSMRLYRQKAPGDWSSVLDAVERDLAARGDGR